MLLTQETIGVTLIDSVLFCNQFHRRYITSTGDDIIEGIGSIYGLFPLNCPLANGWLICYQEKENDECVDCNIFTSSQDFANFVKMYPNPASIKIRINPVHNISLIEIYDFQGKLIEVKTNDFEEITLKNNGIYILRIKYDDKLFIYKVVRNSVNCNFRSYMIEIGVLLIKRQFVGYKYNLKIHSTTYMKTAVNVTHLFITLFKLTFPIINSSLFFIISVKLHSRLFIFKEKNI